jgi:hypothetical protein
MKKIFAIAFVASLGVAAATSSQAVPVASVDRAPLDMVTTVAGGCGEGWHRGPRGGCLRNYVNPRVHACPRGYHIGPGGRCRGNW